MVEMTIHRRALSRGLIGALLGLGILTAGPAQGQTECPGPLGANGPELCVLIREEVKGGREVRLRGPSPQSYTGDIGPYWVNLRAEFVFNSRGMAVYVHGDVERRQPIVGMGSYLSFLAEGGLGVPLDKAKGQVMLFGEASGPSSVTLSGSVGTPLWPSSTGLIEFVSFEPVCSLVPRGEAFACEYREIPLRRKNLVAVAAHMTFHITNVGDRIHVPGGAGLGDPPPPSENGDDGEEEDDPTPLGEGDWELAFRLAYSDLDFGEEGGSAETKELVFSAGYMLSDHHEIGFGVGYAGFDSSDSLEYGASYAYNFRAGEMLRLYLAALVLGFGGDRGDLLDYGYGLELGLKYYLGSHGGMLFGVTQRELVGAGGVPDASHLIAFGGLTLKLD